MRRCYLSTLILLISSLFVSCAPASSSGAFFFYVEQGPAPTVVLLDRPDSDAPHSRIALAPPPDCGFWSLTPAPLGPWMALEWQCSFGLVTQLVDTDSKKIIPLFDDASLDSHFLSWSPDGKTIYVKTGLTTNPQILRVDVLSRQATALAGVSPNTYNFTVSPTDGVLLWAFSNGIGLGSQVWGANADGSSPQVVLSDPAHIVGLIRYSPDGKHVAAIRQPDGQEPFPAGELWLADSDGKRPHLVATTDAGRGMFPVWSPGGEKIAYIGRTDPRDPASINLSILTLSDFKPLTINLAPALPPVWSPDGDGLYVTLAADGKMELWFYQISTGKSRKLFDNACCAGWTGGGRK